MVSKVRKWTDSSSDSFLLGDGDDRGGGPEDTHSGRIEALTIIILAIYEWDEGGG